MADGAQSPELAKKKHTAEKARLAFSIESQELEIMETEDKVQRLKDNIKASKEAMKECDRQIEAIDKAVAEGGYDE